jgi:hypothetical protein
VSNTTLCDVNITVQSKIDGEMLAADHDP